MKNQALRAATLLKSDFSKDVFTWILPSFKKNTYLRRAASESATAYIILNKAADFETAITQNI